MNLESMETVLLVFSLIHPDQTKTHSKPEGAKKGEKPSSEMKHRAEAQSETNLRAVMVFFLMLQE